MGPDGLEPSPTRLRAGYAAANTSIPLCVSFSGAGGIRTLTLRVKSSLCSRYTTTPRWSRYPFQSLSFAHGVFSGK